jgi:hypothetical protein
MSERQRDGGMGGREKCKWLLLLFLHLSPLFLSDRPSFFFVRCFSF